MFMSDATAATSLYLKQNKNFSRSIIFTMQFQHRLRTTSKQTSTSVGSNFSSCNFTVHKTFSPWLELVLQRSHSTTKTLTVAGPCIIGII